MGAVNVDAVEARFLRPPGRAPKGVDDLQDLFLRRGLGRFLRLGILLGGRRDRLRARHRVLLSRVTELREDSRALGVDGLGETLERADVIIPVQARHARFVHPPRVDVDVPRDEQSHAVPGQCDVEVLKPLRDEPVPVREAFPPSRSERSGFGFPGFQFFPAVTTPNHAMPSSGGSPLAYPGYPPSDGCRGETIGFRERSTTVFQRHTAV